MTLNAEMKERQMDERSQQQIKKKRYVNSEMWQSQCWSLYNTHITEKGHFRQAFSSNRPLTEEQFLKKNPVRSLVVYSVKITF